MVLPQGHEFLRTETAYWKMSQMKEGDNRLRIMTQPIAGWIDWEENRPVRYRPDEKPSKPYDPEKPVRQFWALYVWDYAREGLYILEISQSSVIKAIKALEKDVDWGDTLQYDLKVNKTGSGKDTRYTLMPAKPTPITPKMAAALRDNPVNLEALYSGGDPWSDLDIEPRHYTPIERPEEGQSDSMFEAPTPLDELKKLLAVDGIDITQLSAFLSLVAARNGKSIVSVVDTALEPLRIEGFKKLYLAHLTSNANLAKTA